MGAASIQIGSEPNIARHVAFVIPAMAEGAETPEAARLAVALEEQSIPVGAEVTAACELVGLDPLHVANEGRFIAFVAPEDAERAMTQLRRHAVTNAAAIIGEVAGGPTGQVSCRGPFGVQRIVDMLNGEQLPRIC
jgi:hydrogenase expression/formation protein HypE